MQLTDAYDEDTFENSLFEMYEEEIDNWRDELRGILELICEEKKDSFELIKRDAQLHLDSYNSSHDWIQRADRIWQKFKVAESLSTNLKG